MIKFLNLIFILMIALNARAGSQSADKGWDAPTVPKIISENVLYFPIMYDGVKNIPIKESGEELVDLLEIDNPRIKSMALFDPKLATPYKEYSKVRRGVYERLLKMLEILPDNIGIVYSEGFRPLQVQKKYFDDKFREMLLEVKDKRLAYEEASKYVSPFINNTPTHATGAAIDMTLFETKDGQEMLLDMGKYDIVQGQTNQNETFSPNTSTEQRDNRLILLNAAAQAGLVNYGYEWWHYSYGDKVWAFVTGQKYAIYGLAADKNDPILSIDKETYFKGF